MYEEFKDKVVLVTGHTGFKGAWLCEWLLMKQARVVGYSMEPPSEPALFDQLGLSRRIEADYRDDIRDLDCFTKVLRSHTPDFIFHMAAQTLVGKGYEDPIYNYGSNIMGTINVLEAMRLSNLDCVCIVITTDKVYENKEWLQSYREDDPFGGYDPYSASKACAEICTSSYLRSYFLGGLSNQGEGPIAATVRAGNVIGGGDWAADRIVPDCIRALTKQETIPVRNKVATRPWQHVLEPLNGYLALALVLKHKKAAPRDVLAEYCSGFNFGPNISSNKTVKDLVAEILKHWPGEWADRSDPDAPHEAGKLNLTSDKSFHLLNWRPRWAFETTIEKTTNWYKQVNNATDSASFTEVVIECTRNDILDYEKAPLLA